MSRAMSENSTGESIEALLRGVRRRAGALLILERIGWLVGTAVLALVFGGVLDYFLRSPSWLRTGGLILATTLLALAIIRFILPALRFAPSLTDVALRLERSAEGQRLGLSDRLAAAADLGRNDRDTPEPRELHAEVIRDAEDRSRDLRMGGVLSTKAAMRGLGWSALAIVVAALLVGAAPMLALTGAARMLWPWGSAEWPKRTAIADVTGIEVHPQGTALALRAALTRSQGSPSGVRVAGEYRLIVDGRAGAWKRVVLAHQDRTVEIARPKAADERIGVLFERLIEPTGLRPEQSGTGSAKSERVELEYALSTPDDQTDFTRVLLVEPPRVVKATANILLPAYARDEGPAASEIDLGPGTDERASAPASLAGADVTMRVELSRPIAGLPASSDPAVRAAWATRTLGLDAAKLMDSGTPPMAMSVEGSTWNFRWRLDGPARFVIRPTDEYGISSGEDATFRFDAAKDNAPTASIVRPAEDTAVLPTAIVELAGEGRDDVRVSWVAIERQLARRPADSPGGVPEPLGERTEIARQSPLAGNDGKLVRAETRLDLSSLGLKPGDELWITALAADAFELDGVRHEPTRSSVRKLRVLSRDELIEQVWSALSQVRRAALRIDQEQTEAASLSQRLGEEAARRGERAQAGLTERMARQSEALERVQARMDENGLSDQSLRDIVRQSMQSMQKAGQSSVSASQALSKAAQSQSREGGSPEIGAKERGEAAKAQESVRDELSKLIDMLDQGEDTFAAKRSIERLLEQQKALRQSTENAAKSTSGRSMEQLSGEEKEELSQIAQEQQNAAESLKDAVRKMGEREDKLKKTDPAAAQAMSQAARRAERDQTAQTMQQAAQQAKQNQVGAAQQQQSRAIKSMEQMLKDIEQTASNRDEVLRRQLASLIESIEGLIARQEACQKALDLAGPTGRFAGLDADMVALHQQTLGVVDQAEQGPRELRPVAAVLSKAADAQALAIADLRAAPVRDREARTHESESLDRLNEAKTLAEKTDDEAEERQAERQRDEIKKLYLEALDKQISIKDSSAGLVSAEASRRTRSLARQLGQEQEALRLSLADLLSKTSELSEAKVFEFAHTRIDAQMRGAKEDLEKGEATTEVVRRQTGAARTIKSLIDALEDQKKKDKPFRDQSQGGGSGSGQGGKPKLLPPTAEVKLLRDLQQAAADLTRGEGIAESSRDAALQEATELQSQLTKQAAELLERLQQQGGPEMPTKRAPSPELPEKDDPSGDIPNDQPGSSGGAG